MSEKIRPEHLRRAAYVYVRQSSPHQVRHHRESQRRQYALADRALQAQERAQRRLAGKGPDAEDTDVARAQAALGRAMARLTVAGG